MPSTLTAIDAPRADVLYESLRSKLEPEHNGQFIVLHPASGDYLVGGDGMALLMALSQKHPDGTVIRRRIGPPTMEEIRLAERLQMERRIYEASQNGSRQFSG